MKPDRDGFTGDSAARVAAVLPEARMSPTGWLIAKCPFCIDRVGSEDRRGKFGVNAESGIYHCFRCGAKGGLKPRDQETARARCKIVDLDGPRENPHVLPEGFWSFADPETRDSYALEPARAYMQARGVSFAVAAAAGLGACATGRYAGRIIVPVHPHPGAIYDASKGPLVGFVARAWTAEARVKYLYPSGMPRGTVLYNGAALDEVTEVPVMVVEGSFDTYPFWPDAVGLLGDVSEAQIAMLCRAQRPVAVVQDGDAWRKGVALAQRLRWEGVRAGAVTLPPRTDPDEVATVLEEARWECIGGEVVL